MPDPPKWDQYDARFITEAITAAALCAACIVKRTGVPRARVERLLSILGATLKVSRVHAMCDGCLLTREVFKFA